MYLLRRKHLSASLFIVILFGGFSCSRTSSDDESVDAGVDPSLRLIFSVNDTILRTDYFPRCFCNLTDSGIVITHINGVGFAGESLITVYNSDSTHFRLRAWTDYGDPEKYLVKKQKLTLGKSKYVIGDIVTGKISLSGYSMESDSTIFKENRVEFVMGGGFRCELKDTSYTYKHFTADLKREWIQSKMERLERIALLNPDSIVELNLNSMELQSIPEIVLRFSRLKSLNLNSNRITTLDVNLLSKLSQLEELNLSYNEIHEIPLEVSRLRSLKSLDLSANPIGHIGNEVYKLDQLIYLDLGATSLSELSGDIGKLKKLEYLNISSNSVKIVPREIFNLNMLEELWLPDAMEPVKIKNMNLKSLRSLHAPFSFLWFNRWDIRKFKDLEWLYPVFVYENKQEFSRRFPVEMQWLKKELPGVDIVEFTSLNSEE